MSGDRTPRQEPHHAEPDLLPGAGIRKSGAAGAAQAKLRPSRWWYLISAVVGVGLAVAVLAVGLGGFTRGLDQMIVPGEASVVLDDPGRYTVFLEHRSSVDGRVFDTGGIIPGLNVAVVSGASGRPVELRTPGATTEYSFGSRSGISVLEFSIDEPGTYVVAAQYPDGATGPEVVLAVGRAPKIISTILGALGAVAMGVTGAVVTFVRRRRAKRRPLPRSPLPIEPAIPSIVIVVLLLVVGILMGGAFTFLVGFFVWLALVLGVIWQAIHRGHGRVWE